MKNLLIVLSVGLLCNLSYADTQVEDMTEEELLKEICSYSPTKWQDFENNNEQIKFELSELRKKCPEDSKVGLRKAYCASDNTFIRSNGSLLAPNEYLDGKLKRETDLAIWRMKNIVRMYKPEYLTYPTQIDMWIKRQLVRMGKYHPNSKGSGPEYLRYSNFTEHRKKLAQMFNEIADELCPEGKEFCGLGKHYWSDTAAKALRAQAKGLLEQGPIGFEVQMESMAGSKYYKTCVGSAETWFSIP